MQEKRSFMSREEFILKQYEETHRIMFHEYAEDMKDLLPPVDDDCEELSTREIEDLLKQESVERAYKSKKRTARLYFYLAETDRCKWYHCKRDAQYGHEDIF